MSRRGGSSMKANCSRVLTEVGKINNFVSEKRRLVKEDFYRDGIWNIKTKQRVSHEWG